ncbi:MAG: PA domain-containing protein [Brasilonema sp.]
MRFARKASEAIVIVRRGEIRFSEKAKNASVAGAVGLVIVNNQPGDVYGTLGDALSPKNERNPINPTINRGASELTEEGSAHFLRVRPREEVKIPVLALSGQQGNPLIQRVQSVPPNVQFECERPTACCNWMQHYSTS